MLETISTNHTAGAEPGPPNAGVDAAKPQLQAEREHDNPPPAEESGGDDTGSRWNAVHTGRRSTILFPEAMRPLIEQFEKDLTAALQPKTATEHSSLAWGYSWSAARSSCPARGSV